MTTEQIVRLEQRAGDVDRRMDRQDDRLNDHGKRIGMLERQQAKLVGMITGAAGIASFLGSILGKYLGD